MWAHAGQALQRAQLEGPLHVVVHRARDQGEEVLRAAATQDCMSLEPNWLLLLLCVCVCLCVWLCVVCGACCVVCPVRCGVHTCVVCDVWSGACHELKSLCMCLSVCVRVRVVPFVCACMVRCVWCVVWGVW